MSDRTAVSKSSEGVAFWMLFSYSAQTGQLNWLGNRFQEQSLGFSQELGYTNPARGSGWAAGWIVDRVMWIGSDLRKPTSPL
jgi:hypothetical protein